MNENAVAFFWLTVGNNYVYYGPHCASAMEFDGTQNVLDDTAGWINTLCAAQCISPRGHTLRFIEWKWNGHNSIMTFGCPSMALCNVCKMTTISTTSLRGIELKYCRDKKNDKWCAIWNVSTAVHLITFTVNRANNEYATACYESFVIMGYTLHLIQKISPVLDWRSTLRNWRFCQVQSHVTQKLE